MTTFDQADYIDFTRTDPHAPESEGVDVRIDKPRTDNGLLYSPTVVVNFDPGRFPKWFTPFRSSFRRLDLDPAYGFYTATYKAFPLTALVANEPGHDSGLVSRLRAAAEKAGWKVYDLGYLSGWEGYNPAESVPPPKPTGDFVGKAKNILTREERWAVLSLQEVEDLTFDRAYAECSGSCECIIDPDGTCQNGWPSKLSAVGVV